MLHLSKRLLVQGLLLTTLASSCAFAASAPKELPVQVVLTQLNAIQPTENGGDELYFSVTEYSSVDKSKSVDVPDFPEDWLSAHVKEIKHVTLWDKTLKDKESVMLLISLLDRDAPPWNIDDLIGTVKLKVKNDAGKLTKEWSIPNRTDTRVVDASHNRFELTGDGGEYTMTLAIEQKAKNQPKPTGKIKARQ